MAQTTPDASFGPFFVCMGLCWPLLAVIGYSMATVGLRGPALAFVGRCWLLWAFLGLVVIKKLKMKCTLRKRPTYGPNDATGVVWALFRFVGLRWPSLAAVGLRGPALAFVGRRWLLWAFLGLRWPLLAVVGCCGPSWA